MSYSQVFLHYVWGTKDRHPTLIQPYRQALFDHIQLNAAIKNIKIDRINGFVDHVHCLVWMGPDQSIDQIARLLKGESSYWFNRQRFLRSGGLEWQRDYFVASVSMSNIGKVRSYIDCQEQHHQIKTFAQEYEMMEREFMAFR